MRTRARTPVLLAGIVVLVAACSGARDQAPGGLSTADEAPVAATEALPTEPPPARQATTAVEPATADDAPATADDAPANAAALDFTARRLGGGTIDGIQLAGGDVVLWMWAPWCPQCNREAPHVADAVATYGHEVTFVGIAGHDTDDAHRAFVAEHGLDGMVHLVDDDGSLWSQYGVSYQPAWVFVDEDGSTERVAGGLYQDLDARLQALVDG